MKRIRILIYIFILFSIGCSIRSVDIKDYELNKTRVINVGDSVFRVGINLKENMRFFPTQDISIQLKNSKFFDPIKPPYEGIYDFDNNFYYVSVDKNGFYTAISDEYGRLVYDFLSYKKDKKLFTPVPIYRSLLNSKIYELTYSGKYKNIIKFTYKEYFVDISDIDRDIREIKPSFFEKINYDLDEGDIIVYKKFKIQIINATHQSLEYKIVADETTTNPLYNQ